MTGKRETENEQDPRRNLPGNQVPRDVVSTPSQAEGDRETVEQSLREKEQRDQRRQNEQDSQNKPAVF